jgi:hypothetical protein
VRPPVDRARLRAFLEALGRATRRAARLYLVGGAVVIDLGLRPATLDIDFVAEADDPQALDDLEHAIRRLRDELDINVEPASPADFLPIPRSLLQRSRYIGRFGALSVYYYDIYYDIPSLVIAKAARALERDLDDVERLVRSGEVEWSEVEETWQTIRASPTGWLRYEPDEVEQRLDMLRDRLHFTDR